MPPFPFTSKNIPGFWRHASLSVRQFDEFIRECFRFDRAYIAYSIAALNFPDDGEIVRHHQANFGQ